MLRPLFACSFYYWISHTIFFYGISHIVKQQQLNLDPNMLLDDDIKKPLRKLIFPSYVIYNILAAWLHPQLDSQVVHIYSLGDSLQKLVLNIKVLVLHSSYSNKRHTRLVGKTCAHVSIHILLENVGLKTRKMLKISQK